MYEALVSVVHFIVSTPAAISCVGGGGHRTSSSSNCSTPSDVGVHRTAVAVIAAAGGGIHPASDYRVCGASTRRVRSTSSQWRSSLHSVCRVCDGGTRRVCSASAGYEDPFAMNAVLVAPAPAVCAAPAGRVQWKAKDVAASTCQMMLRAAETLGRRLPFDCCCVQQRRANSLYCRAHQTREMTLESDHMSVHWTRCRVTSDSSDDTGVCGVFRTLTVHHVMRTVLLSAFGGPFVCSVA